MLSIIDIKKTIKQHTADMDITDSVDYKISGSASILQYLNLVCYITHIGLIPLYTYRYILLKITNEQHRSFHFCRAVLSTHSFRIDRNLSMTPQNLLQLVTFRVIKTRMNCKLN
jgi:hypothetical protein